MVKKFSFWFNQLGMFAKTLTIIIAFLVSAGGLVLGYNAIIINNHDKKIAIDRAEKEKTQRLDSLIQSFKSMDSFKRSIIDSLGSIHEGIRNMNTQMEEVNKEITKQVGINTSVRNWMIKNASSSQQSLEILKAWEGEKKNNETSLSVIPPMRSTCSTQ